MAKKETPAAPEVQPNGADEQPAIGLLTQYVKDLSFENPNAPAIFQATEQPQLDVQFNIGANQLGEDMHEVVLKLDVTSKVGDQTVYVVDLSYAGLFGARNVTAEQLQPFMLGEAPRILFPFARRVLADAVRDGGFPPLLLEPIDFNGLYLQQAEAHAAGGALADDGVVGHA